MIDFAANEDGGTSPGHRLRAWHRPVLITGGAGFVGSNLAHRLLSQGRPVVIYDSLVREGARRNLQWLRDAHGANLEVVVADVQAAAELRHALRWCSHVYHFAAQVAVTASLRDPATDFAVNAEGTLTLLECLRELRDPPPLVYTSTNKVYGALNDIPLRRGEKRWEPEHAAVREAGIGEDRPLDFHSPYGCSKGAADQYVRDYARSFGLRTIVLRMSCVYGPRQFGTEDQGWVAHFLIRALNGEPIDLYGDGRQVRDVLFVDDLVDALQLAQSEMPRLSGGAYNIGGGPRNTTSLLELIDLIASLTGERPATVHHDWRVGDQRYFVSDTSRFSAITAWSPRTSVREGVTRLHEWLRDARATAAPLEVPAPRASANGRVVGARRAAPPTARAALRTPRV